MEQIFLRDSKQRKPSQQILFSEIDSFNLCSRSAQMKSQQFPVLKSFSREPISITSPNHKILRSGFLKIQRTDDAEDGANKSNTPLINIRRQYKVGRLKRLIEIKDEVFNHPKQRFRSQDLQQLALPINITKLKSPFLMELLNKGLINGFKGQSTKKKRIAEYNNKMAQHSQNKKKVQKCLKEIYEKELLRNKLFYETPLSEAIIQQTNFLNIESIKPANPEQSPKRKSMTRIIRKRHQQDKANFKATMLKRKSLDNAVTYTRKSIKSANSQILQSKHSSPMPMSRSNSNRKSFKPPYQKYHYRDFIWKIAYSHSFVIEIPLEQPKPFKAYIGNGNNKLLVKSLLKQRSWWVVVDKYDENCHFAWTQIKIPEIFKGQKSHTVKAEGTQKDTINEQQNILLQTNGMLTHKLQLKWNFYFNARKLAEQKSSEQMISRNKYFSSLSRIVSINLRVHNHLENNYIIGNKKALFQTMSQYYELLGQDVFQYLPTTFHIQQGLQDPEYSKFLNVFYEKAKMIKRLKSEEGINSTSNNKLPTNTWIVKPGEFTNRGNGIHVCPTLQQIKNIIKSKEKHPNGNHKTYIVQTYLDKPFLYNRRKFDIRHYMMISSLNGVIRGYWYEEGYLRTTSFEYNLGSCSSGIHLTNDAIQKYLPDYGKYEKGNKLSYGEFEQYLQKHHGNKRSFYRDAYPRMKQIATDAIKASYLYIDRQKREHNFQIFGMDFMIDENFQPWLIQINTNPCLELACPLLARLIPEMVQNALLIGLDPLFPPPSVTLNKGNPFKQNFGEINKFQLVFDSSVDGANIQKLYSGLPVKQCVDVSEDDEVYDDDGKELDEE